MTARSDRTMRAARKAGGSAARRHAKGEHIDAPDPLAGSLMARKAATAWHAGFAEVHDAASGAELKAASGYDLAPQSGMISLDIPPGVVDPVPGGVDDHHVTVAYLGKKVTDAAFDEACDRARQAAAAIPGPLTATLAGIGSFPPDEQGRKPVFIPASIPGGDRLRAGLEDLSASQHPDWKPHVTLAMASPDDPLPPPQPRKFVTFTHLSVHRGDDVRRFPFGGTPAATKGASGMLETKVGPAGYTHGWVYHGVPGVGDHVQHPSHGKGIVTGVADGKVTVKFSGGAERSFEHTAPKPGKASGFVKRGDPGKTAGDLGRTAKAGDAVAVHSGPHKGLTGTHDGISRGGAIRVVPHGSDPDLGRDVAAGHLSAVAPHEASAHAASEDARWAKVRADTGLGRGDFALNSVRPSPDLRDKVAEAAGHASAGRYSHAAASLAEAEQISPGRSWADARGKLSAKATDSAGARLRPDDMVAIHAGPHAGTTGHVGAVTRQGDVVVFPHGQYGNEKAIVRADPLHTRVTGHDSGILDRAAAPHSAHLPAGTTLATASRGDKVQAIRAGRKATPGETRDQGIAKARSVHEADKAAGGGHLPPLALLGNEKHADGSVTARAVDHEGRDYQVALGADKTVTVTHGGKSLTEPAGANPTQKARELAAKLAAPKPAEPAEAADDFWAHEQPKAPPPPPAPKPKWDQGGMFAEPDKLGTAPMFGDKFGTSDITKPNADALAPAGGHAATARAIAANVRLEPGLSRFQREEAESRLYAAASHLDAGNHAQAAVELDGARYATEMRGGAAIKGSTAAKARDLAAKIRAEHGGASTAGPAGDREALHGDAAYDHVAEPVGKHDRNAADSYTAGYNYSYNQALRKGAKVTDPNVSKQLRAMDAAFTRAVPTTRHITMHRGLDEELFGHGDATGTEFTDKGFTSVSTDPEQAAQFRAKEGGALMEIHVPAGSKVVKPGSAGRAAHEEKEIVLNRGGRYQITSDKMVDHPEYGRIRKLTATYRGSE